MLYLMYYIKDMTAGRLFSTSFLRIHAVKSLRY